MLAGGEDGLLGAFPCETLRIGKVDEQDSVFEDDADEEDEPDKRVEGKGLAEEEEGEEPPDKGGGQRAHHGERVDEVLIEDAEDDVDDEKREGKEVEEALERGAENLGGPLHLAPDLGREDGVGEMLEFGEGLAERGAGRCVKGEGDAGEAVEVVDGEGGFRIKKS